MRPLAARRTPTPLLAVLVSLLAAGAAAAPAQAAAPPGERPPGEEEVVRQFALEHVELPAAMILLRTMIDARRLVPNDAGDAIVVRDTLPKIELAARLLELYDRPPAEVEVDVDRLTVDASVLRELARGAGEGSAVRVPADRLASLAGDGARRLTTLSALSGDRATYQATGAHPAADRAPADLELSIEPRVHAETGEVSLDVAAEAVHLGDRSGPRQGFRKLTSSVRLGDGAAFLLVGLLPETESAPGRVPVLALTPRIVRTSGLRPADLETVHAGALSRRASSGPADAAEAAPDASP